MINEVKELIGSLTAPRTQLCQVRQVLVGWAGVMMFWVIFPFQQLFDFLFNGQHLELQRLFLSSVTGKGTTNLAQTQVQYVCERGLLKLYPRSFYGAGGRATGVFLGLSFYVFLARPPFDQNRVRFPMAPIFRNIRGV